MTGTSSEFLGKRPLPRLLKQRPVVFVLGPAGVGKTSVARRVAGADGRSVTYLSGADVSDAILDRTRNGYWEPALLSSAAVVLDGLQYVSCRPGVKDFLQELLAHRSDAERMTVVVEAESDGSAAALMSRVGVGECATLGLRFPSSRSGRMRFARRYCDELGIERSMARGTDQISPWRYEAVIAELVKRKGEAC